MVQRIVIAALLGALGVSLSASPAFAQANPCRVVTSIACQTAQWDAANAAFDAARESGALPTDVRQLLVDLLKRPDMALPASEVRRAQALQLLAAVRLALSDSDGSIVDGRQALAIWQRRATVADTENYQVTVLNLASALMVSQKYDEAMVLGTTFLEQLGPLSPATDPYRLAVLELLTNLIAGRKGPIDELVSRRTQIVALVRTQAVHPDDIALHRLQLARALGNLGDSQTIAQALEPAYSSLSEAKTLLTSIGLADSDPEWVLLRTRYLPLLVSRGERCEVENVATALLPFAEPLGGRLLSQILIQHGENYRSFGATSRAAPLWSRATGLELAMACPVDASRRTGSASVCLGSPMLIDHLRAVGTSLRYEGQGRANAAYRSLYQAGDFLRARTLGGFALNRDAANAYAASRDIFRDQITTAWAVNDRATAPKPVEMAWNCGPR